MDKQLTQNLPDRLTTLFSPNRRTVDGVEVTGGSAFGRTQYLIPRSRLIHRHIDLSKVAPARRRAVIDLKLNAWRPFGASKYWVGWQGSHAQVWAGEADQFQAGANAGYPETVMQAPGLEGLRLVACIDGFEGQFWDAGVLRQTRWWNAQPSPDQWRTFARASGQLATEPPAVSRPEWLWRPWAKPPGALAELLQRRERPIVAAALVVLSLALGWQLAGVWQLRGAIAAIERQQADLHDQTGDALAARERALRELEEMENILEALPSVFPLVLKADVSERLPAETQLLYWQHEGRELRFSIEGDGELDAGTIVSAVEQVDGLRDVIAQTGTDRNLVEIQATTGRSR